MLVYSLVVNSMTVRSIQGPNKTPAVSTATIFGINVSVCSWMCVVARNKLTKTDDQTEPQHRGGHHQHRKKRLRPKLTTTVSVIPIPPRHTGGPSFSGPHIRAPPLDSCRARFSFISN